MLEFRRVSKTSSPIFSSLSLSMLNFSMSKNLIGGLFYIICLSRLTMDNLPDSLSSYIYERCNSERQGQMLASRVTTSSSIGSHYGLKYAKLSLSSPYSGSSYEHIKSRNSLATQDLHSKP